jgi:hypothetical protein
LQWKRSEFENEVLLAELTGDRLGPVSTEKLERRVGAKKSLGRDADLRRSGRGEMPTPQSAAALAGQAGYRVTDDLAAKVEFALGHLAA